MVVYLANYFLFKSILAWYESITKGHFKKCQTKIANLQGSCELFSSTLESTLERKIKFHCQSELFTVKNLILKLQSTTKAMVKELIYEAK